MVTQTQEKTIVSEEADFFISFYSSMITYVSLVSSSEVTKISARTLRISYSVDSWPQFLISVILGEVLYKSFFIVSAIR